MARIIQVGQRPSLINNLSHGLSFVSDKEVNQRILTKYRLYTFLTPCDPDNTAILQSIIDQWKDYTNELYKVRSLRNKSDYRPLENYRRTEILRNVHADNGNSATDVAKVTGRSKLYNSGYDSDTDTLTSRTETETDPAHSSSTSSTSGTDNDDNLVYGNIGVTTAQQMLQQEIDLVMDIVDFYVSKFAEAFNLDMEVNCYGRY